MAELYVANRYYPSKRKLLIYVRSLLYAYDIGESLTPRDQHLILALLQRHPSVKQKVGCGIVDITVEVHPSGYGSHCLWLWRVDGSGTDISFRKCLRPPTKREEVQAAFRRAIDAEIVWFKTSHFQGTNYAICPVTGGVHAFSNLEVHHRPPFDFKKLVDGFLDINGLSVNDIKLVADDGMAGKQLANREIALAWRNYHRTWANLQLISSKAHVQITMSQLSDTISTRPELGATPRVA